MTGHRIILLGGGGHARMLRLFLMRQGHAVLGCVSPAAPAEATTRGAEMAWLGDDAWLAAHSGNDIKLVNGIGSIGSTAARRAAFEAAAASGKSFLDYCHPTAIVDAEVTTGEGLQVLAGAIVQPGCRVGRNVLVNSGAVIEHDVTLGDHVHVAPGACVCGGVHVDAAAHVGAGAVVSQGCTIGEGAVIGAGAVVLSDVLPGVTVAGIPARPILKRMLDA